MSSRAPYIDRASASSPARTLRQAPSARELLSDVKEQYPSPYRHPQYSFSRTPISSPPAIPIGPKHDPLEAESDRMADHILNSSFADPAASRNPQSIGRTSSAPLCSPSAPPSVHRILSSAGQPLDNSTRRSMETSFGRDFSHVRVHTTGEAAASATEVQSSAYTVGSQIVFAEGQFTPSTPIGRGLLAHELTHVVQQSRGPQWLQRAPKGGPRTQPDDLSPAQAGGKMGETDLAFALGQKGFEIVLGPGGPGGHRLNAPGVDVVAHNPKSDTTWVVDNKATGSTSSVRGAEAVDPAVRLRQNLQDAITEIQALPSFPSQGAVLNNLHAAAKALDAGESLPTNVRVVVTNAGGYHSSISKDLKDTKVVTFEDITGATVRDARKRDIKKAKANQRRPGRPATKPPMDEHRGSEVSAPKSPMHEHQHTDMPKPAHPMSEHAPADMSRKPSPMHEQERPDMGTKKSPMDNHRRVEMTKAKPPITEHVRPDITKPTRPMSEHTRIDTTRKASPIREHSRPEMGPRPNPISSHQRADPGKRTSPINEHTPTEMPKSTSPMNAHKPASKTIGKTDEPAATNLGKGKSGEVAGKRGNLTEGLGALMNLTLISDLLAIVFGPGTAESKLEAVGKIAALASLGGAASKQILGELAGPVGLIVSVGGVASDNQKYNQWVETNRLIDERVDEIHDRLERFADHHPGEHNPWGVTPDNVRDVALKELIAEQQKQLKEQHEEEQRHKAHEEKQRQWQESYGNGEYGGVTFGGVAPLPDDE